MDSQNEKDTKSSEEEEDEKEVKVKKIDRIKKAISRLYKNITIEPAMFVLGLAGGVVGPFFAQFEITKICQFDFGYNDTVCNDENLVKYFKEENDEIQREYAYYSQYKTLASTIFPIFFAFYMGAWCDMFGRKLLMRIFILARIITKCGHILCAYFMYSSKWWILVADIPSWISGGGVAFGLTISAFMADITTPETLTFRLFMVGIPSALAVPVSPLIGNLIYLHFGYVGVLCTSMIGFILGGLVLLFGIRSYNWQPEKKEVTRSAFSPQHPLECLKTVFKKRNGPNRKYILIFLAISTLWVICFVGTKDLHQPYVRTKFEWYHPQISKFISISAIISFIGIAIFVPLIKITRVSESLVLVVITALVVGAQFFIGLATESWMIYLAIPMTCLVPYAASILIAMQISCVPQDEFGKMGAARSALVKILPVLFNFLYVKIWDMTSMTFPGGIYILSGGIASVALVLTVFIHYSLHGKTMAEVTADGSGRISDEEKRKNEDINLTVLE